MSASWDLIEPALEMKLESTKLGFFNLLHKVYVGKCTQCFTEPDVRVLCCI